jgi:hypothetical protein
MSGPRQSARRVGAGSGANPQSGAEQAEHYRHYAAQFRSLAGDEQSSARRGRLAKLARRYAQLAARVQTTP